MRSRSGLSPILPLVVIIALLWICIVRADPIEMHAKREVERRQLLDNGTFTTSSSPIPTTSTRHITTSPLTPTTSNPPATSQSSSAAAQTTARTSSESVETTFSRSVSTYVTDIVTTINGVPTTMAQTIASTTLIPTTIIPGLQDNFGGTGLSDNSKKIVIGVVVGVGGAAVLALIAVIIWRHTKKENEEKRNTANLTYFGDDPAQGGYGSPGAGSPGANKEELRSPQFNAAANF